MRLCLVGPAPPLRGGIPRVTAATHLALLERGLASRLVAFRRLYPPLLYPGRFEREPPDPTDPLGPARLPEVVRALDGRDPTTWTLAAAPVAAFEPDAVLLPWWTAFWAPALIALAAAIRRRARRARIFLLCHQVEDHEPSALTRAALRAVLSSVDGALVPCAADVIAIARMAPRLRTAGYGGLPAGGVIPLASDPRPALRAQCGLRRPTVLALGFIRPYKGFATLIRAVALAAREVDLDLVIAGESWGGEAARLTAVAAEAGVSGRVRIVDRYVGAPEAAALLGAADLVALPYESGGNSGVAGVAVEHGRPLLVTRTGALPDFVADGESGYVVPPRDPDALARALVDFIANARHDAMAEKTAARRPEVGARLVGAIRALVERPAGVLGATSSPRTP